MAINQNDDEESSFKMEGYRENGLLKGASWLGILLSLGILRFIFYLYPVLYLKATHTKTTLNTAQKLLVTDCYEKKKTQYICTVKIIDLTTIRMSFQNVGYKDVNESNRFIDEQFEAIFKNDTTLYFNDGSYQVLGDVLKLCSIKKLPYVWDKENQEFKKLAGIGPGLTHQDIHHFIHSNLQRHIMRQAYGDNVLEVPDSPFIIIALKETFSPFYLVQFVNSLLWGITGDWTYTITMFIFTFLIILLTSAQTKWNQHQLKKSVSSEDTQFQLISENELQPVASSQLVPGDRIILPSRGCKVPCDGIVLSGSSIVNESMLTGESVLQSKSALPANDTEFKESERGNQILYGGTNLIKSRGGEPLIMLVTRTGFSTSQGAIVRSFLYPRPLDYQFELSVIKFAIILFSLSLIGAIINDIVQISRSENVWKIIVNTVKIAIMLIPAIMPILTATKLIGISRLVKKKIYCINPAAFNLAGSATCICFDKTGTLTEDGLDLYSVVICESGIFQGEYSQDQCDSQSQMVCAMASCHSLSLLDDVLVGDPIDIKIFEWTQWQLKTGEGESGKNLNIVTSPDKVFTLDIIHECQFSSTLQRMSSVVRSSNESGVLRLYCKGAPETIVSLCHPESVPEDFEYVLESYTRKGYRVLGLSTKTLEDETISSLQKASRYKLEQNMIFLGLIAFQNKLKLRTISSLKELNDAEYNIKMITGDNQQTADSVAMDCGIIKTNQTVIELSEEEGRLRCLIIKQITQELANSDSNAEYGEQNSDYVFSINGKAWHILQERHRDILPNVLVKSTVFARVSSEQKKQIVTELGALGYGVVMCGDGANDCGALRAADVGISLSQSETSVAASFTSHVEDISCVPHVIRFGRCSLATSICFFKYMIMAAVFMAVSERLLQSLGSNMSSGTSIYLTLITNVNIAVWFSRSVPYLGPLPPDLPFNSVLTFPVIFSLISNLIVYFGVLVGNLYLVKTFSWYRAPNENVSYESYSLICTLAFQHIILAISQSPAYPFREPIYKNYLLSVALITLLVLDFVITLHTPNSFIQWFQIFTPPTINYPLYLLLLILCNFAIVMFLERYLIDKIIYKRCKNYPYLIKTKTKQKYIEIEKELPRNYDWFLNGIPSSQKYDQTSYY